MPLHMSFDLLNTSLVLSMFEETSKIKSMSVTSHPGWLTPFSMMSLDKDWDLYIKKGLVDSVNSDDYDNKCHWKLERCRVTKHL